MRNNVCRYRFAQKLVQSVLFLTAHFALMEMRLPLAQRLHAALKTDSSHALALCARRVNHKTTNTVVGDQVHEYFLAHHVRCFTAHNVHTQGGFDVAKEQLNIPSLKVKFSQFVGWVLLSIEQGGDEVKCSHPEARRVDADFNLTKRQLTGTDKRQIQERSSIFCVTSHRAVTWFRSLGSRPVPLCYALLLPSAELESETNGGQ